MQQCPSLFAPCLFIFSCFCFSQMPVRSMAMTGICLSGWDLRDPCKTHPTDWDLPYQISKTIHPYFREFQPFLSLEGQKGAQQSPVLSCSDTTGSTRTSAQIAAVICVDSLLSPSTFHQMLFSSKTRAGKNVVYDGEESASPLF
jgi:hypothetical protein